jgi:hypothetical protein
MNVELRDRGVLERLSHVDVRSYLAAQGWREIDRVGDKAIILGRGTGDEAEILLPIRQELGDYAARMAEVVAELAKLENRWPVYVLRDLEKAGWDVIRVRSPSSDGNIPVNEGSQILEQTQGMLLAAACAAVTPRPVYQTRKPTEAVDYMRKVQLGQTEQGSFVINLLSPVKPALGGQLDLWGNLVDEPFERQVTATLARGLTILKKTISEAAASSDFKPFEAAVASGISANLCESIAGLIDATGKIEIGLAWATVRPVRESGPLISFGSDDGRILGEAARQFRSREPRLDQTLVGWVISLRRGPDQPEGTATLSVLIDGQPRLVTAVFGPHDYSLVCQAHEQRKAVICEGDLHRVGRGFVLENVDSLALLSGQSSEKLE